MQVRNDATAPPLVPGAAGGPKRLRCRDRQIIFENMTSACPVREAARPPRQSVLAQTRALFKRKSMAAYVIGRATKACAPMPARGTRSFPGRRNADTI